MEMKTAETLLRPRTPEDVHGAQSMCAGEFSPSSPSGLSPPARVVENTLLGASKPRQHEEEDIFLREVSKLARKPAPSTTQELRVLRADRARLEKKLKSLCHKWRTHLPDPRLLEHACATAKNKWVTAQAEEVNRSLKEQLLQQQLYLASLQHLVMQSPFLAPSRAKEFFEGMHSFTSLSASQSTAQRVAQLQAHCELGVRLAPALMERFAHSHVAHVTPQNPFSHTSIMADNHYTYVSNILLCKIPHRSLDAAVGAALAYFRNISSELHRHLGVQCDFRVLHALGGSRNYTQLCYRNGPEFSSMSNTTLAVEFSPEQAVIVVDFVDHDEVYPTRTEQDDDAARDSCLSLFMSTERDPVTGQECVVLQRLNVNRYNLAPQSPKMLDEIRSSLPWFNGDLFMEVMCREIEHSLAPKVLGIV